MIACLNETHRQDVIKAMPIPGAMYIIIGANVAGRRFSKAVIMTAYGSYAEHDRVRAWAHSMIYTRMLPDYQHEVYII